ncbi:MAG: hypothetical protein V1811_03220 [Candidatus Micrarchaeota archaeon]
MAVKATENKMMGKNLADYWKVIQLPVYVSIALSFLSALLLLPSLGGIGFAAMGVGLLLSLVGWAVWLWAGWRAVKEFNYELEPSAIAGALGGAVSGFVGAVFILVFGMFFGAAALSAMGPYAEAYAGAAMASLFTGLITGPLFGAIFGAILTAIGAFAAKNMK